jgi:hypothetical protein
MERALITGLRAGIVDHRKWPISKWYYANSLWYYHRRRGDDEIVTNWKFYQLVDPDLRHICHLLNQAGLGTTPSCQGHFYEQQRFEHIWQVLTRERDLIRGDGLIVKDSETDRERLFKQSDYALEWRDFGAFFAEAAGHQGTGYLGVLVPREREDTVDLFREGYRTPASEVREEPDLGRILGGFMFSMYVRTNGSAERSEEWRKLTEWVRDLLKRVEGSAPSEPSCAHHGRDGARPSNIKSSSIA